jgi:hypothetical protein
LRSRNNRGPAATFIWAFIEAAVAARFDWPHCERPAPRAGHNLRAIDGEVSPARDSRTSSRGQTEFGDHPRVAENRKMRFGIVTRDSNHIPAAADRGNRNCAH